MKRKQVLMSFLAALAALAGWAAPSGQPAFPDAAALPPQTELPDPLVMFDGRRITNRT